MHSALGIPPATTPKTEPFNVIVEAVPKQAERVQTMNIASSHFGEALENLTSEHVDLMAFE